MTAGDVARLVIVLAGVFAPAIGFSAAGDLDPTFGTGGRVTTPIGTSASARAVAIDGQGRVVVAGAVSFGSDTDFGVARYTAAGAPDVSFAGGVNTFSSSAGLDWAQAVVVQPDGGIVVGGRADVPGGTDFALLRLDDHGALDPGFGAGGVALPGLIGNAAAIEDLAIDGGGNLLAAGWIFENGETNAAVVRLDASGVPDPSFGVGGRVRVDLSEAGQDDAIAAIAPQADGGFVVAGSIRIAGTFRGVVARFDAAGHLDGGFGVDGRRIVSSVGPFGGVIALPDGTIIAAASGDDAALVRFTSEGALDAGFGVGGVVVVPGPGIYEGVSGMVRQPDGRIVIAGTSTVAPGTGRYFLARVDEAGVLDAGFGVGGVATTSFGGAENIGEAVALQSEGRLVVTGDAKPGTAFVFGTARFIGEPGCGDGLVDPGEACDDANAAVGDCCRPDCTAEPDGGTCSDGSICTEGDACAGGACVPGAPVVCPPCEACAPAGGCVSAPRTGCTKAQLPFGARLVMNDRATPGGDSLSWTLPRALAVGAADLGDPLHGGGMTFCVFGPVAGSPLFAARLPGGGTCGPASCWKSTGGPGFRYRDRLRTQAGISAVQVRAGGAGRASAALRANGSHLALPALPVTLPLRVQLQADGGGCWETIHGLAGAARNDAGQFSGRGQ